MARLLKAIGLLALFHYNNAAEITCVTRSDFANEGEVTTGQCTLKDPKDASKLMITEKWLKEIVSQTVLPFTHFTVFHPTFHATQDFIHFKNEENPLQAYTYYIPKRNLITICSPYQCIHISSPTTHFYIVSENAMLRYDCPKDQFITAFKNDATGTIDGACILLKDPGLIDSVLVESSSSSFFYLSREQTTKYHIIDHRFTPPQEIISEKTTSYLVSKSPSLSLIHLEDYNSDYLSEVVSSKNEESHPILAVTGTYFSLKQRPERRYMVQTLSSLYSLLDDGKDALTLKPEEESFYHNDPKDGPSRRVVLQIFPDNIRFSATKIPEVMQYSALYKEAYGYENRRVDRTITGAYAWGAAMDIAYAKGEKKLGLMIKQYAMIGASYLFSLPTYYKNIKAEEQRIRLGMMLKAAGNKDWDQVGQEAPLNDGDNVIQGEDAEGTAFWYGGHLDLSDFYEDDNEEDVHYADKDSESVETAGTGKKERKSKVWRWLCYVLLVVVALAMIVVFATRMGKRPSIDQIQPSSTLLTQQEQHII